MEGVMSFKKRNGYKTNTFDLAAVQRMNTPLRNISTIKVNMERCRWIDPTHTSLNIIINIPAFKLTYSKNGKELESNLLVGKNKD
jgi:murein L,D-transpeptidase YcbB/YkuD